MLVQRQRAAEDQRKVAQVEACITGLPTPLLDGHRYLIRFARIDGSRLGGVCLCTVSMMMMMMSVSSC